MAMQEQYSRRECLEFVGLPENLSNLEVEDKVVQVLKEVAIEVGSRDSHAVHRLKNKKP